ncbi:hypothetical protein B0919_13460 [Hymenobacter sp. CRA2]|nr:hypothetical protein B0919_13460 [Hymenobacter sp. CRA2]
MWWLSLGLVVGSCAGEATEAPEAAQTPEPAVVSAPALAPAEAARHKAAVTHFLQWYQQHLPELDKTWSAAVSKQGRGDTAHYVVNFIQAEQYLERLRQSGVFSKQFVEDQRQQFRRTNEAFRSTRQAYGTPVGYDYGWILYTPRPAEVLSAALRGAKLEALAADKPVTGQVLVHLPTAGELRMELVDEAGTLKIEGVYPNGIEADLGQ